MYKALVRRMIRRNTERLNRGDLAPTLSMFADDAILTFPGDNSWSTMIRPVQTGREVFVTHRGKDEIARFLERYVEHGVQMVVEDVLVNGPPWNMRVAARVHDWVVGPDGNDVYANRAVLFVHARWGKVLAQEDYEDTERAAAYDRYLARPTTP